MIKKPENERVTKKGFEQAVESGAPVNPGMTRAKSALLSSVAAGCALLAFGCTKADEQRGAEQEEPQPASKSDSQSQTWYRAAIVSGELEIPFFLSVSPGGEAAVVTGDSRVKGLTRSEGGQNYVEFPLYRSRIGYVARGGQLEGRFEADSKYLGRSSLRFRAKAVMSPLGTRLFPPAGGIQALPSDLPRESRWRLSFEESGEATLVLNFDNPTLSGALTLSTGNSVALAGNVYGEHIYLSGFDGAYPYLLSASFDDQKLEGRWIAGPRLEWREQIKGTRSDQMLEPSEPLLASERLEILQLLEEPYKQSPVIVELGGSWCPACKNSIKHLRKLYERYHEQGLEILSLSYEFTEDRAYNQRQAALFKEELDIPWNVIPVHGDLERAAEILPKAVAQPKELDFPIILFADRTRRIHGVRPGLPRPEDEVAYDRAVAQYEQLTQQILAAGAEGD